MAIRCAVVLGLLVGCSDGSDGSQEPTGSGGAGGADAAVGGAGGTFPTIDVPGPLSFVGDFNLDSQTMLDGVPVGGLSGLWIDPDDGRAWAICDDQNAYGPPRFYELDMAVEPTGLRVVPRGFTAFDTGATPAGEMDAEGIARTQAGELFISSEGDTSPVVAPAILRLDANGTLLGELPVDDKLVPDDPQTKGVRRNKGLEALTLSPSGQTLFVATEEALRQDGPVATFDVGTRCRIARYDVASGQATGEFVYVTEPIPAAAPGQLGASNIGLVELLALDDERMLALERAAVQVDGAFTNTIRVFLVSVAGATDVSGVVALGGSEPSLGKSLVVDLDTLLPHLDPAFPRLDNVEGMSFGPPLPDGRRTLWLMSDNNFNATQRTAFFALAIDETL